MRAGSQVDIKALLKRPGQPEERWIELSGGPAGNDSSQPIRLKLTTTLFRNGGRTYQIARHGSGRALLVFGSSHGFDEPISLLDVQYERWLGCSLECASYSLKCAFYDIYSITSPYKELLLHGSALSSTTGLFGFSLMISMRYLA
jgi:hypothetical protein